MTTNSTKKNSYWEANSCSTSQNFPIAFIAAEVHYRVQISPPLNPIQSHSTQSKPPNLFL